MSVKKANPAFLVSLILMLFARALPSSANNVSVDNVRIENPSHEGTCEIVFDMQWENSWRNALNHDAVWVFLKYSPDEGITWRHATLAADGHFAGSSGDVELEAAVPDDRKGAFIRRADSPAGRGDGPVSSEDVSLVWNWGPGGDNINNATVARVRVFAVEMVYIPGGAFRAGSGGDGENEFDLTYITGAGVYPSGYTPEPGWPNAYGAFYAMRYEISQGQYAAFLNTLTVGQRLARYDDTKYGMNRYGIKKVDGKFVCSLGGTPGGEDGGCAVACNWLSWADLAAYADWAALRPITELEYEKMCRGTAEAVADEFPWGAAYGARQVLGLVDGGKISERHTYESNYPNCAFGAEPPAPVEGDPIEITDLAGLQAINENLSGDYVLMNDIDASPTHEWNWNAGRGVYEGFLPIGCTNNRFTGSFDGRGHTISNLYINRCENSANFMGLFGYIEGVIIKNVGLIDVEMHAESCVAHMAALVGYMRLSSTVIKNSFATGSVTAQANVDERIRAGGLVGWATNDHLVENCYARVDVTATRDSAERGGLIAHQHLNSPTVKHCYSTGKVEPKGGDYGGGFIGRPRDCGIGNFFDTETSGWGSCGDARFDTATARTTAQMQSYDTFENAGWDIARKEDWDGETWFIDDGNDYPRLGWEMPLAGVQGPVRTGLFARGYATEEGFREDHPAMHPTNRPQSGSGFYGNMDLAGNVAEICVSIEGGGGSFTGAHGDGELTADGYADVPCWPGPEAAGTGIRGGSWQDGKELLRVSDRTFASEPVSERTSYTGGRCARAAP